MLSLFAECDTSGFLPIDVPPSGNAIKWHTGGYITPLYSNGQPVAWTTIQSELQTYVGLRGAQLIWSWPDIETAEGVYDFSDIDAKLATLAGLTPPKRLIIRLQMRSSHSTNKDLAGDTVPAYMIGNATYSGGQWRFLLTTADQPNGGGKAPCLWNANVRVKLRLLAQALGDHLNSNPYVEAVGLVETALGTPFDTVPADYKADYLWAYYDFALSIKAAFPNTMTYIYLNYDRPDIKIYINGGNFGGGNPTIPGIKVDGMAMGGPNTLPDEVGLNVTGDPKGAYLYYPEMTGIIPCLPSWQTPDFRWTKVPNGSVGGHKPTIQELYDFSLNNLFANYICITRQTGDPQTGENHWSTVLTWLNSSGKGNTPNLGLLTAKPSAYPAIITT